MNQSDLPELILIEIFHYLTIKDLVRCFCVSKRWRDIVKKVKLNNLFLNYKRSDDLIARLEQLNLELQLTDDLRIKLNELNTQLNKKKFSNYDYNGNLVDNDNIIYFSKFDLNFLNTITFKLDELKCLKILNAEECRYILIGNLCNLIDYKLIESYFPNLEHLEMPIIYQFKNDTNSSIINLPEQKEKLKLNLPQLKILSIYNILDDLLFELELNSPIIEIIDLQNINLDYLQFTNTNSFSKVKILQINRLNFISSSILTKFKKLKELRFKRNDKIIFSYRSTQMIFNQLFFTRRSLKLKKLKIYFIDKLLDPFKNFELQIDKNDEKYCDLFTSIYDTEYDMNILERSY